ncbi:hypothetical protein LNV09_04200 [Paucibacter sp. B2R-40]|uniref:hypothetical protein n=1 Tax=Paucibacter sp. B2R-40 TaxID=2893554 RepID=UPI0021E4CD66|nr:hypothetical protein [Paucibacter sp. B2R-40]MCV2353356.1 hypothetical protein [Paucibacter sp. B2R-40]
MSAAALKSIDASNPQPSTGHGSDTLELYLGDTRQLFNSMDPAPFHKRDIDPKAADYIVDWAREVPAGQSLSLIVHLGQLSNDADDTQMLRGAMHDYFARRAVAMRKKVRQLLRTGRISLLIGLAFMALMMVLGEAVFTVFKHAAYATLLKESLMISGWVALWRPAEIFLHEWWPMLGEARLYDRVSQINVRLKSESGSIGIEPGLE